MNIIKMEKINYLKMYCNNKGLNNENTKDIYIYIYIQSCSCLLVISAFLRILI